jgi:ribonuclease G
MKEVFIERRETLLRIAIKDSGKLVDCFMEEDTKGAVSGQIYKGIVKNIVPGIKCAFLDIGLEKNAYLYMDTKLENTKLKKGEELIVEVLKEELGDKGAKVTNKFSIAGRYVALITINKSVNFSSKIDNNVFKDKVRSDIKKPEDIGLMIRTNAQWVDIESINNEVEKLYKEYKRILQEGSYSIKPKLLYSDEGVMDRVLRDNLDEHTERLVVDSPKDFEHIKKYVSNRSDVNAKVELFEENRTLFDFYNIEKDILALRNPRVNLNCGGYIIIEKTEAMYVIDVNSGKNISGRAIEKTAMHTNLEAAETIAKQIRLRNLSGIILIDFIDVNDMELKRRLIKTLEEGFSSDKNKTIIFPFTELNLVQIARRRRGKNISEFMEEDCSECKGKGRKLKNSYMFLLIKNELLKIDEEKSIKDIYIEINESYKERIEGDILTFIKDIGGMEKNIYLNFTSIEEYFKIEPLIFMNQINNVQKFKVYGENFFTK